MNPKKSSLPAPVVVAAEINIEVHPPGAAFLNEEIGEGKIGEEPLKVSLANFCRPAVRWKGRVATLDFNGFVKAGIWAIEAQLARERGAPKSFAGNSGNTSERGRER